MSNPELNILVRAKDEASRVLRGINSSVSGTSSKFSKFGSALGSIAKKAAIGLGAAGTAGGLFIKSAIGSASDLNESLSKVSVVFGKSGKDVIAWSKTSATAMGQSRQQALEAAGTFGNLFRAMKFTSPEASDMSTKMVELAGDLASFNNADPKEVLENLRSGLIGEAEPLRKFGVQLSAARIEQEAVRMGLIKSGEELTAKAKSQAAYNIIMKDTALAHGDFARTADGAANKQRIVAAQFENAKASLGQAFLPIWQKVLGAVSSGMIKLEPLIKWVKNLIRGISEGKGPLADLGQTIKTKVVSVFTTLKDVAMSLFNGVIKPLWNFIRDNLELFEILGTTILILVGAMKVYRFVLGIVKIAQMLVAATNPFLLIAAAAVFLAVLIFKNWDKIKAFLLKVWNALKKAGAAVWNAIKRAALAVWNALKAPVVAYINFYKAIFRVALSVAKAVWGAIKDAVVGAFRAVKSAASTVFGWLKSGWRAVKDVGVGIWDAISGAAKAVFNGIASAWNNTVGKLSFRVPGWVPGIGGAGFDVPDIHLLAAGGIVTRPTLAIIGEGGPEAVVPLHKYQGGSPNVFVSIDRRRWVEQGDYEVAYRGT